MLAWFFGKMDIEVIIGHLVSFFIKTEFERISCLFWELRWLERDLIKYSEDLQMLFPMVASCFGLSRLCSTSSKLETFFAAETRNRSSPPRYRYLLKAGAFIVIC